jgi:hypothetical protein
MKSIEELNQRKTPIVKIDDSLEKYKHDNTLFQDKVEKANQVLKTVGLPSKKDLVVNK